MGYQGPGVALLSAHQSPMNGFSLIALMEDGQRALWPQHSGDPLCVAVLRSS